MITNNYNTITKCRISNSTKLTKILDLGVQPLANSLKKNNLNMKTIILYLYHFVKTLHCFSLTKRLKKKFYLIVMFG